MNALLPNSAPTCVRCGHIWPRDPCFEVPCPTCGARGGARFACKRPSGHSGPFVPFHAERDLAAAAAGAYAHHCSGATCACCGLKSHRDEAQGSAPSPTQLPLPTAAVQLPLWT